MAKVEFDKNENSNDLFRRFDPMMKQTCSSFVFLMLFLLFYPLSAQAYRQFHDSFRCGTQLVSIGDSKYEVLRRCGEPTWVEVREEERVSRDTYNPYLFDGETRRYRAPLLTKEKVIIEEWTYNLGSNHFIRYLTFENGRLVSIESGGYGY